MYFAPVSGLVREIASIRLSSSASVSCTDECDSAQPSILENIPEYMLKENENNRPNDTFLLENDDFSELDSIADEYILHKKELEKDLDSIPEITD